MGVISFIIILSLALSRSPPLSPSGQTWEQKKHLYLSMHGVQTAQHAREPTAIKNHASTHCQNNILAMYWLQTGPKMDLLAVLTNRTTPRKTRRVDPRTGTPSRTERTLTTGRHEIHGDTDKRQMREMGHGPAKNCDAACPLRRSVRAQQSFSQTAQSCPLRVRFQPSSCLGSRSPISYRGPSFSVTLQAPRRPCLPEHI